jgi:hypothetical protein
MTLLFGLTISTASRQNCLHARGTAWSSPAQNRRVFASRQRAITPPGSSPSSALAASCTGDAPATAPRLTRLGVLQEMLEFAEQQLAALARLARRFGRSGRWSDQRA